MSSPYQLTCPAELASLPRLHSLVEQACDEHPAIDIEARYALLLALDEACANIIEHGYAGLQAGLIVLRIDVEAEFVRLAISDFGHPFEPLDAAPPDLLSELEERKVGGLGIYFIRNSMDEVDFERSGSKNTLLLTKYFGD